MQNVYAIIGGGTSGITALGQLVNRLIALNGSINESIKLVIYEKDQANIATGMPYNINSSPVFLLNGPPANNFRLLPDGTTLQEWMRSTTKIWQKKFPDISTEDLFPPRALVGHYFKDQYAAIKKLAKENNIIIEEKFEEVINITPITDSCYEIVTKNGDKLNANKIVLSFGHLPSDNFKELNGKKNFINSPYALNALKDIPAHANVYVIGGHLSFIDLTKELVLTNNFQGKIICVTRNPSFVTLRDSKDKCDKNQINILEANLLKHEEGKVSWTQFHTLFWNSYENATKNPVKQSFLKNSYGTRQILKYQLAKFNNEKADEQSGNFDELRDFITEFCIGSCYTTLWKVLDKSGKEEFAKHFYSLMVAAVAGIPPINARFLVEMYEKERIQELTGITSVNYDKEQQLFILKFADGSTRQAEYLINATGAGRDITKHLEQYPLFENLIKNEVIKPAEWSGFTVKDPTNILAINPIINYYHGKPGLSAVYLGCFSAQDWIDQIMPLPIKTTRPICF